MGGDSPLHPSTHTAAAKLADESGDLILLWDAGPSGSLCLSPLLSAAGRSLGRAGPGSDRQCGEGFPGFLEPAS